MLDKTTDNQPDRDVMLVAGTRDAPDAKHGGSERRPASRTGDEGAGNQDQGEEKPGDDPGERSKPEDKRPFWRKHPIAVLVGLVVLVAAIVAGVLWYLNARHFEETDDAFIDSRPVSVSAEVTGNLVAVPVTDNQLVKSGDVLAKIDERNYTAAVENAQAQIDQAQAQFENIDGQIGAQKSEVRQAEHQVAEAQAALDFSRSENQRYQDLVRTGAGTVQRAQQASSDLLQKQASLDAAQSNQAAAEKQIAVLKAQRRSAQAQIEQAQAQKATADANLSRTVIHATVDGRVARLTGAVGFTATQGQVLMVVVPLDVWVTANYKETQLADMRVGQPVDIAIDAYGKTYPGRVDSIQPGSGTAFSLLPAQNATGNYVKVVQRVPVKLTFNDRPDIELGPGLSVVPKVRVR